MSFVDSVKAKAKGFWNLLTAWYFLEDWRIWKALALAFGGAALIYVIQAINWAVGGFYPVVSDSLWIAFFGLWGFTLWRAFSVLQRWQAWTVVFSAVLSVLLVISFLPLLWAVITTDVNHGMITGDPQKTDRGREVRLLVPGEDVARTFLVDDIHILPLTKYWRTRSADLHGTFVARESYCIESYGVRIGFLSVIPVVTRILDDAEPACQEAGAPAA